MEVEKILKQIKFREEYLFITAVLILLYLGVSEVYNKYFVSQCPIDLEGYELEKDPKIDNFVHLLYIDANGYLSISNLPLSILISNVSYTEEGIIQSNENAGIEKSLVVNNSAFEFRDVRVSVTNEGVTAEPKSGDYYVVKFSDTTIATPFCE